MCVSIDEFCGWYNPSSTTISVLKISYQLYWHVKLFATLHDSVIGFQRWGAQIGNFGIDNNSDTYIFRQLPWQTWALQDYLFEMEGCDDTMLSRNWRADIDVDVHHEYASIVANTHPHNLPNIFTDNVYSLSFWQLRWLHRWLEWSIKLLSYRP